jgi:hypothetical protein
LNAFLDFSGEDLDVVIVPERTPSNRVWIKSLELVGEREFRRRFLAPQLRRAEEGVRFNLQN